MTDEPRLLCLGDSYTIGEGVGDADRWPSQLAARLRASGFPLAPPTLVARTGWTIDELEAGIADAAPADAWAAVTLLAGVNDQYRGRPLGEFRAHWRRVLLRAVRFAGGRADRVVAISIPDWGVTAFAEGRDRAAIAAAIDERNAIARSLAELHHARWVDVTDVSRELGAAPAALAADGLHPSASQYARWTDRIEPHVRAALAAR